MSKIPDSADRKEVLEFISDSASYGNLGAFIGAGFSKAVLNNDSTNIALSWGELLKKVSNKFDIKYSDIWKEGVSYPDIASKICQEYSDKSKLSYKEALAKFKKEIAQATSWYPNIEQRAKFSPHLDRLDLSWVITTNYDMIIESLLTGRSIPLGPNEPLIAPSGIVPIFHLHGARANPEEIIITQEDYIGLFRPTEYRQIKLALMMKESTTLIMGYGLGDVNVLTALDWSKNVFKNESESYPNDVIQVIKKSKPKKTPYRDKNSVMIIETTDLIDFFEEFSVVREKKHKKEKEQIAKLKKLAEKLNDPNVSTIKQFIDDTEFRDKVLKVLSTFPNNLIASFVSFLNKCIEETWERSKPSGAFDGYADNLTLLIDILTNFSVKQIPPALFQTTAHALERVGYYVGDDSGQSFAAGKIWKERKEMLDNSMITELKNFSEQYNCTYIPKLLRR
ncbi:SIR2 family NAD-dependent protein deacylase [Providencia hangzhouensis]|uniref:SIR2 family NAD-dependent protein deacylase n=1 Tax=Providencia hangzhouensis TaxID=3031799 RepID=UPI0034DCFF5A